MRCAQYNEMERDITLRVNGKPQALRVKTHHTLLHVLREQLSLFSVREGCGVGMCGACTILLDGKPVSACLLLAVMAEDQAILTVEGLMENGKLHPIQQAYIDGHGFQCSYCTPGFILASQALLATNPQATDEDIREYLGGNLCRCGSYVKILDSVKLAREASQSGTRFAAPPTERVERKKKDDITDY